MLWKIVKRACKLLSVCVFLFCISSEESFSFHSSLVPIFSVFSLFCTAEFCTDLKVKRFLSSTPNSTAYSLSPEKKKKTKPKLLCNAVESFSGKFRKNKSLSKWHPMPQPGDVFLPFDLVKVVHSVRTSGAIIGHCLHLSLC